MAHTAGPDASVATAVVDLWNWITAHAARFNEGRDKAFDQLSPSLRAFNTSTSVDMQEHAQATFAWRLPVGFDADAFSRELREWVAARSDSIDLRFHAHEVPWRGDRQNALVRSFLSAIRTVDPAAQPGFVLKTGTSDMNVVAPVWKCPVVAYGPGDSSLDHTPHEHVPVEDYWRAVLVVEAMLRGLVSAL
jgi:[amino group carrier protein]-lysine/ornithine hydrolase